MENMFSFISTHNKKLFNSRTGNIKPCNCRKKDECPLDGQCLAHQHQWIQIKPIYERLKEILRKDTIITQNHLDTSGSQRKQQ